jgi:predicted SAM-dependent methyltransferase
MSGTICQTLKNNAVIKPPAWKVAIQALDEALSSRILAKRAPDLAFQPKLLNLGCGPVRYPEWVNADFYTFRWAMRRFPKPEWVLDATKPWNCPDNYWDGIFTEHVLEHFNYKDAIHAIVECYRTLKPGAWLRISVPDINKYINGQPLKTEQQRRPLAVSSAAQQDGHKSVWDPSLMMEVVAECGFTNIRDTGFGQGTDERLIRDQEVRREFSLYVEAQKPSTQS